MVAFGPDGYLYWGLGDGGRGGDPLGNGQNPSTLLGSILRLDTNGAAAPGNPFAQGGGAAEVFLYGLRNPWRFSFDGNDLYIGDVGQGSWEEVSVVDVTTDAGANLGWNRTEGAHCYLAGCSFDGITLPVAEYSHASGCSVTGGYVYRGSSLAGLDGTYVYGDYCSGRIWSFRLVNGEARVQEELTGELGTVNQLSSFGVDGFGELYVVSLAGTVYKVVPG
jgi:glucose/arabinose dehydrogenase